MKTFLHTLCAALIFSILPTNTLFAQTEYKLDSVQLFQYDAASNKLLMTDREHYSYDNRGTKATELLILSKKNNNWLNNYRETNSYNRNNNILSKVSQTWNASITVSLQEQSLWYYANTTNYQYDRAQNNTVVTVLFTLNNGITWLRDNEKVSEYQDNLITLSTLTTYNFHQSELFQKKQTEYQYNNQQLNTQIISRIWNNTFNYWQNDEKVKLEYLDNLLKQQDTYKWETQQQWAITPQERIIYNYDNRGNLISSTTQISKEGVLYNSTRTINIYATDRLTETVSQNWTTNDNGSWENTSRLKWDQLQDNTMVLDYDEWSNNDWLTITRSIQYSSEALPFNLSVETQQLDATKVSPNPFHKTFDISLNQPLSTNAKLQIFNIDGSEISNYKTHQNQNLLTIDLINASSGMYFVNIASNTVNKTFKVVKY